ncbi:hypothetical protein DSM03_101570 [Leeuwenhoekiella aestuarii]|uniref:Uncharacterized protein n=1 Tax=Leeuwenhoekiella aestuarii TaxID=2249426 RepID=A0A4Q0NYU9_9FLAO|nr:hypothetical protein DSM04_10155 [Leeuwenhoekiella aestuarii]RXG19200.1 hypothetical protein DSM03_101570 [Leeuwenhoekiella aestuarii]
MNAFFQQTKITLKEILATANTFIFLAKKVFFFMF